VREILKLDWRFRSTDSHHMSDGCGCVAVSFCGVVVELMLLLEIC